MSYVDFFNIPLPKENEAKYTEMAKVFSTVMKEHGLLHFWEAIAENVPTGEVTDFHRAVQAKENETIVSACYVWPDKETRDKAWELGMKDERMEGFNPEKMPFDGMRMFWGGFRTLVEG